MGGFDPKSALPFRRKPDGKYPYYTVMIKHRGFFRPKYEVFGVTHPYSATHATRNYYPTGEIHDFREMAVKSAKDHREFIKQDERENRRGRFLRRLF
jgi:hypothetical protein